MKILYVFGGEKASGAEIVIERLFNANLEQVTPFLIMAPGEFARNVKFKGLVAEVTECNNLKKLNRSSSNSIRFFIKAIGNYFLVSYTVNKLLLKHNINVIHSNTIVPSSYLLPVLIYSKLFYRERKWLWSDHDLEYFSKIDHKLSEWCLKLFSRTLVVSSAVKSKFKYTSDRIVVLYNGISSNSFYGSDILKDKFRTENSIDKSLKVILMAATIAPRKNQLGLIEVFKELIELHPNCLLILAGGWGGDDEEYNLKVQNYIDTIPQLKYLGKVDNMLELYNGADVILNNSSLSGSEPLGTTIYEAMACGKIVLGSNTGGTPEIITDNVDGYLFRADDNDDLLKILDYVLNNLGELQRIKVNAVKKVSNTFNIESTVKQYNEIISQLINT